MAAMLSRWDRISTFIKSSSSIINSWLQEYKVVDLLRACNDLTETKWIHVSDTASLKEQCAVLKKSFNIYNIKWGNNTNFYHQWMNKLCSEEKENTNTEDQLNYSGVCALHHTEPAGWCPDGSGSDCSKDNTAIWWWEQTSSWSCCRWAGEV